MTTASSIATTFDPRFSSPEATPTSWSVAVEVLEKEIFWVSTVRANGQPHVTPILAVWHDDALWFTTGPDEQKARNLSGNPRCTITTGCATMSEGLDIVIEGMAEQVRDAGTLQSLADRIVEKYGEYWRFTVEEGTFRHQEAGSQGGVTAVAFRVRPPTVYGFRRGETFSQTAWRFRQEVVDSAHD